jgi:hypothetical protein
MATECRLLNVCRTLPTGTGVVQAILNGTFVDGTGWTLGAGWSVAGGVAVGSNVTGFLTATVAPLTIGLIYRVTYTVSSYSAGGVRVLLGTSAAAGGTRSANGTYTEDIVAATTGFRFESNGGNFTGNIDFVTAVPVAETSVLDAFTAIDTTPPNSWADVGGTLDGTASSGIIVAAGGLAKTTVVDGLHTAYFSLTVAAPGPDYLISTSQYREVRLTTVVVPIDGAVSILMDMANTTPVYTTGLRMKVERLYTTPAHTATYWNVTLYLNDAVVATGTSSPATSPLAGMKMTIDAFKTIRCYLDSGGFYPVITYYSAAYNPVGGRVGLALKAKDFVDASADSFSFWYTPEIATTLAASDLPSRTLVSSANGLIYVEKKDGTMAVLGTAGAVVRTLASDRLLSSVNRLAKLYIADYALRRYGTTGSNAGAVFTDSTFTTATPFDSIGIDADDDRLEILSGTNAPIGIYNITGITATTLTIQGGTLFPTPPQNGSSLTYRICRAPKVFDSSAMTLKLVPIGEVPDANGVARTPGQYPLGCTIVSAWRDRLIWSGDPLFPHVAYFSKIGDPDNYLYANETEDEAVAYDPVHAEGASQLSDAVTAVIPHSYDYCIFAGYRSTMIQRGDPTLNPVPDLISRDIGIIDKYAWCYTPEQVILGLSTDGLYLFSPSPNSVPLRVSRERLPAELLDIDTARYDVQLAYDIEHQGVHICLTERTTGGTGHWWFDWGKKAFWPETYPPNQEPTAMCVHTVAGSNVPSVIFGCRDGYLRRASDASGSDDSTPFTSTALLGPFQLGSPQFVGLLHRIWLEFARNQGVLTIDVLMGDSAERARYAVPAYTFTYAGSSEPTVPNVEIVRARGSACFIRITSTAALPWALEAMSLEREIVGERRLA